MIFIKQTEREIGKEKKVDVGFSLFGLWYVIQVYNSVGKEMIMVAEFVVDLRSKKQPERVKLIEDQVWRQEVQASPNNRKFNNGVYRRPRVTKNENGHYAYINQEDKKDQVARSPKIK